MVGLWARLGKGESAGDAQRRRYYRRFLAAFLLLAIGIIGGGALHLRDQIENLRASVEGGLDAIASQKAEQISTWRRERLNDAAFYSNARFAAREIQAFLGKPPTTANSRALLLRLGQLQQNYHYRRVALFDPQLRLRLSIPWEEADPDMRQVAAYALKRCAPVMGDLHRDPHQRTAVIHLAFPVLSPVTQPSARAQRPIGLVVLQIDASHSLYPFIQSWPTPSRTAETLLVRRDGDSVLYLNDLRHRRGTALKLRLPIQSARLPAAMALRGRTGVVEGTDYRGVPVLAAIRPVPGTSWFVVAKVDQDEIFARLRNATVRTAGLFALLLFAAVCGVGLVRNQRDAELLRRQLEVERESTATAERLAAITWSANDIILLADDQARIVEANERAIEAYGYPLSELLNLRVSDLRAPETLSSFDDDQALIEAHGGARFETVHRRKDGSCFPVEVSARVVHFGGAHHLSVVRDITERRVREREIKRLNRLYALLSEVNQAIVRYGTPEELFDAVCRVAVEVGHFAAAWVARRQEDGALACLALRGSVMEGGDSWPAIPCSMSEDVLRTGRPAVAANVQSDDRAACRSCPLCHRGICSCAALPISLHDRLWGVFTVCSTAAGVFNPEEVRVLEEMAEDMAFALDRFEQAARRREAEEETRSALSRLEAALSAMSDGVFITDADGNFIHFNEALAAFHRFHSKEECPKSVAGWREIRDFLLPDGTLAPSDRWPSARALRGERATMQEYIIRHKDTGDTWFASFSLAPIRGAQGEIVGAVGIVRDITQQKAAEKALRELTQHLQAQQEELQAANEELQAQQEELQAANEELHAQQEELQAANEELRAQTEELEARAHELARAYAAHRAVARSIPDGAVWVVDQNGGFLMADGPLLDWLGLPRAEMTPRQVFDAFGPDAARVVLEGFQRARDGEIIQWEEEVRGRFLWLQCVPLRDEGGHLLGAMALAQDITERRQTEQRLQTALEEKDVLLREVHHRVKNNLQVMIHLLRRRRDQTRDPEARGYLMQLEDQARSMSLVYEQLFQTESIARVEMGAYLGGIVEGLRQTFAGERTVAITVAAGGVLLDAEQAMPCGLIVNELVTNALKHAFSPEFEGTPEIRVSLSQEGDMITLRVSDNGVGSPALQRWRESPTQGMRLVELWATHQLGGTFTLNTERGTTVTITYNRRADED